MKRRFKLPNIQDLSKEQEEARALPLDGRHLIVGGPGTGKSVIALLRAKRLSDERKPYVLLVYNHVLNQCNKQLFEENLESDTYINWFKEIFRELTTKKAPLRSSRWEIDWNAARDIIVKTSTSNEARHYLVIDEGQDMPPAFYSCLGLLGFENFFVVADQNQQIKEDNSNIKDLRSALALNDDMPIELTKNYRNNYFVAKLARAFYTGDPASPPPRLPQQPLNQTSLDIPTLCIYPEARFNNIVRRIAQKAGRDPTKLFGIITPNNEIRKKFYEAITRVVQDLGNRHSSVSTYAFGGDAKVLTFNKGGIIVINVQSCKGLEFDIVFLADINNSYFQDNELTKRRFYVMTARARNQVIMLQSKEHDCPVEKILPKEANTLNRITLETRE